MQAEEAANGDETKDKSLLKTPTRALNRSAGDVMEDISTMLNDLTDELDSMLCSDSLPEWLENQTYFRLRIRFVQHVQEDKVNCGAREMILESMEQSWK